MSDVYAVAHMDEPGEQVLGRIVGDSSFVAAWDDPRMSAIAGQANTGGRSA